MKTETNEPIKPEAPRVFDALAYVQTLTAAKAERAERAAERIAGRTAGRTTST